MSCPEIANRCCCRLWRERLPRSPLAHAPRIICISPGATQVRREEAHEDGWDPHKGPLALNRAIDLHHVHSHLPRSSCVISAKPVSVSHNRIHLDKFDYSITPNEP